MADRIAELETALEAALAESLALREVLAPFAFFAKPAAIELAGGDADRIATVLLEHKHQSLGLGAFSKRACAIVTQLRLENLNMKTAAFARVFSVSAWNHRN